MNITITPLPTYQDNYIWVIHNDKHAVVIDPGLSAPVDEFLTQNNLILSQILITHHHWDHVNGLESLQNDWRCQVYAPADSRIPGKLLTVKENQAIELPELGLTFHVIETPGHTLSHVCFYNDQYLFCGDTLFSMGCGRMFEGDAQGYVDSLNKIKQLPPDTAVYCTHEYTLSNIDFALYIEPDNDAIKAKKTEIQLMRQKNIPSLPVELSSELTLNPFLRTNQVKLQHQLENITQRKITDEVTCFAMLRKCKDEF